MDWLFVLGLVRFCRSTTVYAEVIVNLPVEGTFHYHIPAQLAGRLRVGHLVEVSFGRQKAQAVILGFSLHAPVETTKPVIRLIDHEPIISDKQLRLAEWLCQTYLTPLAECLRLFIPPGLSKRGDILITPVIDPQDMATTTENQIRLVRLLTRRGPLRGRQIARSMPRRDWHTAVSQLTERGLLLREPILAAPSVRAKQVRMVELAVPPARVESIITQYLEPHVPATRQAATSRRINILRSLSQRHEPVEVGWIYEHIEGSQLSDLRALAEDDLITLWEEETWRDPLKELTFTPDTPPYLTPDQAAAWDVIRASIESGGSSRPILLHGVTGSGKTELYLRAVAHVLEQGRSAIILVPEIALTPQTVRRFGARFPGRMGLIHSSLSVGERYDTWRRARSGQFDVIIGPRSALFTPLHNLGLIVIDECHDDSYKQSPPIAPPYYHALPTATELARLHNGLVIMGSATPNVTTYSRAAPPGSPMPGDMTLLELPARIMGHRRAVELQAIHYRVTRTRYADATDEAVMIELPPVQVVDMRQELRAGNRSIFSRDLTAELDKTLERDEQAILFLNRRGTATYVFCRTCGHVLRCPHCDIPLTWHTFSGPQRQKEGTLVCHHCDHRAQHPSVCPACHSEQIRFFGGGTERVERELQRRFPRARPIRWDRDTTSGKDSHTVLLERFINREANVLVGTQMITKGLDLPLVTLVGVISADTALYLPDYRSGERTFQLLTQVAGRAGRGLLGGRVILQTYDPEHYAVRAAAEHDFHAFYTQEIHYRQEMGYPPYARLARLTILAESTLGARREAERLQGILTQRIADQNLVNTFLIGPAPCFYSRRASQYRWHIIVRGPDPTAIMSNLKSSLPLHIEIDPVSLL